ncbi:MAG: alanine racemase [Verrucomicrobia bacterium]|nr:alanine racemase [Verrucomicrobiota bacterium]MCG2680257.1 alanine racemase [Kiritimatiellia bacterium]MBU4248541.1 alanine racemase [Verrucomicrobiota bacterium]MBU4289778.1 alanine racemase [Verrucomicrobiota bacterium]MBU4429586.1 alanine racemase [Verrucomicrobiota bacterium]
MSDLVTAHISRTALRHNITLMMAKSRGTRVCAVVKANAYGHDMPIVVRALAGLRIAFWGVATLQEAIELKQQGVREPVLIFRPLNAYEPEKNLRDQVDLMVELDARATVVSREGLNLLAAGAARRRKTACLHIKVDSGMGRNGCPAEEAVELVLQARTTPGLKVEGLYSHFASADNQDLEFARRQWGTFQSLIRILASQGVRLPIYHMANSGAIFNLPGTRLDMIRPGIALYGYGGKFIRGSSRLQPVLRIEAPVIITKWLRKGQSCGYEATFVARRKTRIGLLPIGYSDGYSRRWSNIGRVDFEGQPAPVIGRVSMDLTIIDLTDIRGADIGSQACIISNRRKDIHSVESMAHRLGTIPHEITSVLGKRIHRVLVP